MTSQHLSDEAVAAFADGMLTGFAHNRATRHVAACAECAYAVAVQREAIWALRSAPAPALPSGLMDRLRSVPLTTPIESVPFAMDRQGRFSFPTFMPITAAAIVPAEPDEAEGRADSPRRMRPGARRER